MVKKLNPSFVEYFATYLKKLLADKNRNNETISAEMFQEQVTTAANVYLNENYGADPSTARAAIAQSTPESECAKAIKARTFHNIGRDDRISDYKTQAVIDTYTSEDTLNTAKNNYRERNPYNTRDLNVVWTSKTNMLLPDATGRKRQQAVEFTPENAAYCGKCWICMTDVMSYSGFSNQWYDGNDNQVEAGTPGAVRLGCKTPCGDCEHVSAIMASYIAGMLTSGGFAEFYWASYYVACVECNRRKSNYIGVKLSATTGWQVDDNGVNAIVDAIFPNATIEPHASEYNPIRNALTAKYNLMSADQQIAFRDTVRKYIVDGTQTWCKAANDKMGNMTEKTKHIKMSFNVSKIIVAITGHLNVITGPLQKRANKAVKAGRTQVKPKIGKKRGGGQDDSDDDMDGTPGTDTESTQPAYTEGAQLKQVDDHMIAETDVKDTPILYWYNLIGEAEVDVDYDDEDDEEDDRETDDVFNARILKYSDVIVEYIGNKYSRLLFKQYESAPMIFNDLMVNLSNSMYDILESTNEDLEPLNNKTLDALAANIVKFDQGAAILEPGTPEWQSSTETGLNIVTPGTKRKIGSASQASQDSDIAEASQASQDSDIAPFVSQDLDDMEVSELNENVGTESSAQTAKRAKTGSASTVMTVFEPIPGATFAKTFETQPRTESRTGLTPVVGEGSATPGGSRLNKLHSKNRTKRVSYMKHKQTRKNQHSRKTK